ncbi:MAG: 3-(3-hydroxy-phenyl)propionate transporter MhpT, partial [Caulobacteraceae bacterium]|nr:3-(3-hydroxy-phenyl)propionate transporter MhpT [Caulobacteraceae bacterium]
ERNDDHLESVSRVLFGEGRAWTTLALWGGFFFTQLVLFLMLNWLPSLLIGLGYTHSQASVASICFGVSGAAGAALLGRLHGGARRRLWVAVTYIGMLISLVILPMAGISFALTALASGLAGVFIIGAQLVLFALAPLYYRRAVRGTGVGAAVAIGRLGSVVGPLYAGALLWAGGSSTAVLLGVAPFVVIGGLSGLALATREQCSE